MSPYALADLLRVREFRENAASREVAAARHRLEAAKNLVQQRIRELDEYRVWRVKEEEARFERIRNKKVRMQALDDLKQEILALRSRELLFEKAITDAKMEEQKTAEQLQEARTAYRRATGEKRKIEEHRAIWVEEQQKEEQRLQDKEMEDFRVKRGMEDDDEDEAWEL